MRRAIVAAEYFIIAAMFACAIAAVASFLQPPPEPDLSKIYEQTRRNNARAAELEEPR